MTETALPDSSTELESLLDFSPQCEVWVDDNIKCTAEAVWAVTFKHDDCAVVILLCDEHWTKVQRALDLGVKLRCKAHRMRAELERVERL